MKQTTNKKNDALKGVSTLDVIGKNSKTILPILILIMALSSIIYGGHSILDFVDPSFNPQIQTNSFGFKDVADIVSQPDGKILVAGDFNSYNRQPAIGFVRLNADATLDTTFNYTLLEQGTKIVKILLQADGKILLQGFNIKISGQIIPGNHLIRLNTDGTLDSTFNYNNEGNGIVDITIDASGRIILSGIFISNNVFRPVIRLNSDGSLDSSFHFVSNRSVRNIVAQNNKLIVVSEDSESIVKRLNEDGTIDTSFIPKNLNNFVSKELIVQPDDKILVLDGLHLQRLNENGSDDTNFVITNFSGSTRTMALKEDGRIVVAFQDNLVKIRRFLANGLNDNSFTTYSISVNIYSTFGLQADGSILIGDTIGFASGTTISNFFSRLFPNGNPDPTFNEGSIGFQTISPGNLRAITIQPNGEILIGGKFDSVNQSPRTKIARLNLNASLDPNFQINTSSVGNYFSQVLDIYNIALQSDGKIIVSGSFNYIVNGASKSNLVRLNSDGSIDPNFNLNFFIYDRFGCCNGGANKINYLSNEKLIVGTSIDSSINYTAPLKLNANGTLDNSFIPTIFATQNEVVIMDLTIQTDGKIIIGGRHQTFNNNGFGLVKSFIARLNSDGTTDETFQISEETDKEISAFNLLPNGKILIVKGNPGGESIQQSNVLRLNSDGTIDDSFNAGTSADGRINVILALPSGRIFVGGRFTSFNGQTRQNLAQLNADGSLDPNIYSLNDEVLSLAVDSEGRVLVGGSFTVINAGGSSSNRSYVARLIDSNYPSGRTRFDFDGDGRADLGVFNNTNGNWSILKSQSNQAVSTHFGLSGDKIAPADFDGDGKSDIAVYRPTEGIWYLLQSTNGFASVRWGQAGDKPVPADYDGDGKADIAVWRPNEAVWYILQSSNNQMFAIKFGSEEDIPLTFADFDGNGKSDIAVWRPSNGNFYWLSSGSNNQLRTVHFGQTGDIPAVADYNGDGKTDLVVFRPLDGNWYQLLSTQTQEYAFSVTKFGTRSDEPIEADYDGDGKCDIAVRRENIWHILKSSQGYTASVFASAKETAVTSLANY